MSYRIELKKQAAKYLEQADHQLKKQFLQKVHLLQSDPHNLHQRLDIKPMKGDPTKSSYRRRLGKWRIIYSIYQDEVLILIIKIDSRGGAYK